jgi:CheY-like chemotaxis protein
MKYKLLVNGKNPALIKDFIQYTEYYFKSLSTTDFWKDVIYHFEVFQPEVYVCFLDSSYKEVIEQINRLKGNYSYNKCPIVLIATLDICAEIERNFPSVANLLIKRPASPDNIALKIVRFLEKKEQNEQSGTKKEDKKAEETPQENVKKHILVVDDDRTVLKMLRTALEEEYTVTTMVNGVLVEKLIDTKNVDLILLDYEMPVETGAQVYKKIKMNEKAQKIPVCFMTGVFEREKIEEIISLKPHGYLMKPLNMDILMITISNLLT